MDPSRQAAGGGRSNYSGAVSSGSPSQSFQQSAILQALVRMLQQRTQAPPQPTAAEIIARRRAARPAPAAMPARSEPAPAAAPAQAPEPEAKKQTYDSSGSTGNITNMA